MEGIAEKYINLKTHIKELKSVLVAFSGGIDSTLLLASAVETLGTEKVLAVTAFSPIHPAEEKDEAEKLAALLGARWKAVESKEMKDPLFLSNPPDRCFHCKKGLMVQLKGLALEEGLDAVVEGSNASDRGDYRPGFKAVTGEGVYSPLLQAGIEKEEIRALARELGLPNWDRPADACLCSRIPYGEEITRDKLTLIGEAEKILHAMGFRASRVRLHGTMARIEVPPADIPRICESDKRDRLLTQLKGMGFSYITVDLAGYRTGSLNESI